MYVVVGIEKEGGGCRQKKGGSRGGQVQFHTSQDLSSPSPYHEAVVCSEGRKGEGGGSLGGFGCGKDRKDEEKAPFSSVFGTFGGEPPPILMGGMV